VRHSDHSDSTLTVSTPAAPPRGWRAGGAQAQAQPREYGRGGPRVRFLDPAAYRRILWDYRRALVAAHNAERDATRRHAFRDSLELLNLISNRERHYSEAR
jgi:hypothetical protein